MGLCPKKHYEGIRFNVVSVTKGWMGVKYPGENCYLNDPFRTSGM